MARWLARSRQGWPGRASCARGAIVRPGLALLAELADVPDLRWPGHPAAPPEAAPATGAHTRLDPPAVATIATLAAAAGTTRFVALLAPVGATAIAEVTGQDDFAVGVPVGG